MSRHRGHAGRVDKNQRAIVDALRAVGATVHSLAAVGDGCPDLLVGWNYRTTLMEVKGKVGPRGGRSGVDLTPDQERWINTWRGDVVWIIRSPRAALAAIGICADD